MPNFSVHRIEGFIDDMNNGIDSVIDRNFGELTNSLTMAMRGKSKFIDCLYLARNIHSDIYRPTTLEWVAEENWHLSYTELIKSLSIVLSNNDGLSLIESNSKVKLEVDKLISPNFYHDTSTRTFIRKKYSEYIGKKGFVSILSKFYRRIKYISILPCKGYSRRCLLSPKSKYYKDVSLIVGACKKIGR